LDESQQVLDDIHQWNIGNARGQVGHVSHHHHLSDHKNDDDLDEATICTLTEQRLKCMLEAKQRRVEERKRKKLRKSQAQVEENQYSDLDESGDEEEADAVNPDVASLQEEDNVTPSRNVAWADFTEIFRNPPSVSPESPKNSSVLDSSPETASRLGSSQDSIADDDWL